MSDTLAAASLLLTAIAVIYSLWYPEMTSMLKLVPQIHKADNRHAHTQVGSAIGTRAIPLLAISLILTLIFAPDSIDIVKFSIETAAQKRLAAIRDYSAVATSLVAVNTMLAVLTIHLALLTRRLIELRRKLNPV
jgi:hypothetical protein